MLPHRIKRWHWIAISLIVGVALGWLNRLTREDWTSTYGQSLSKTQFIAATSRTAPLARHLSHLVVYPEEIPISPGKRLRVHVVAGQYDEPPSSGATSTTPADLRHCFVAEIPFVFPSSYNSLSSANSVMTYLAREKIPYTYAWWRDPRTAMSLWTAGAFLLIGIIWPSLLNLLAYGSVFQPADATQSTSAPSQTTPEKAPALTTQDLADLEKLEADMQNALAATATSQSPPPPPPVPAPELSTQSADAPAPAPDHPETEFGIKRDDYYPTARKPR